MTGDGRKAARMTSTAASSAAEACPTGGDQRICGSGAVSRDTSPAVAWNATANQYLVVWQDDRNLGSTGTDIYGRLVSASGVPRAGDFRISGSGATGNETTPAVVWNGTRNEYLVVWADDRELALSPRRHLRAPGGGERGPARRMSS